MPPSFIPAPLILSSQSPRRRQILETLGLSFRCVNPVGVDEAEATESDVLQITQQNAHLKAAAVGALQENEVVIGADTLVVLGDKVLGKPRNREDAQQMLEWLSARDHQVVTGVALRNAQSKTRTFTATSRVFFKPISEKELNGYLATKEPYDKAGSYAVQGLGALFIEKIEGSYTNVMGLPIENLLVELAAFTQTSVYDWF